MPNKVLRCLACGLVYGVPEGPPRPVLREYRDRVRIDYDAEDPALRKQAVQILGRIEKHRKGGRLLHVGSGPGFLLDEAKKRGWDVAGIEFALGSRARSAQRFGIEIGRGSLSKIAYPDRSFDVVVMPDLLHQLPSPRRMLSEMRRVLKTNGMLYASVPDTGSVWCRLLGTRWWGIHKHHLFYFSKKTFRLFLESVGFKWTESGPYPRIFSLNHWTKRLRPYPAWVRWPFGCLASIAGRSAVFSFTASDQLAVLARKTQRLDTVGHASEEVRAKSGSSRNARVIAVLPAYNAAQTLERTVRDIPRDWVDEIILVDDASRDDTVRIARKLGLTVFVHKKNIGYGGNQKTCYDRAIERGGDVVVMLHPDYQYDPRIIPELAGPICRGEADAVFGSRMMKGGALDGGMPLWKHNCNILLTALENVVLGTFLTEYHSGFRAYSARMLKSLNYRSNSNGFVFDTEIIVQILANRYRIEEVPIRTRYFEEASTIRFWPSVLYGLGIIRTMAEYLLHQNGILPNPKFRPVQGDRV